MPNVVILSQIPLPYNHVGSWTTLYHNYLKSQHLVNYIVCPKPEIFYQDIQYSIVEETVISKLKSKLLKKKKSNYTSALGKIITKNEKYVVQLIDNYGIVKPLHDFLISKGIRKDFYLQFFYHGFDPYLQVGSQENFYKNLDEIVYLTDASRSEFIHKTKVLPKFSEVLHNGIDTNIFKIASETEIAKIKVRLKINNEKVFLWCSQDRPKKGLDLILDVWQKVYAKNKDCILLVIGAKDRAPLAGVRFFGLLPNSELPPYYQVADCYLFSTMCHEGFGMSLIEALHCGCYCIASKLGGVPEVLNQGEYGVLIENPTFVSEWVQAINTYFEMGNTFPQIPGNLYSMERWNHKMNDIVINAKNRLDKKQ